MIRTRRCLVGTLATGILLATALAAVAETYTLTLKRREPKSASSDQTSSAYWSVQPQYFFVQMIADEKGHWRPAGREAQADAFKRIVKKEPKYQSESPFRGVVKFGSQEYAFALDTAASKAKKPDTKETNAKAKASTAKGAETTTKDFGFVVTGTQTLGAATAKGAETTTKAEPAAKGDVSAKAAKPPAKKAIPIEDFAYTRLYFDFNHNGDLTDDKVVEVTADPRRGVGVLNAAMSFVPFTFSQTDITIEVEGTKVDYSFNLEGYTYATANSCQVMVSVSSAIYREGDITLAGKRHHVVLLDNNSNGRFDDVGKISPDVHLSSGQLYSEPGDMLLIDPQVGGMDSPYDSNGSDYRYPLAEMVLIDGKWYDVKVSPAGDKLTLTPSTATLGNITNQNEAFRAMIYRDGKGFLKIRGTKGTPVPVPEGQWKLFSYTITRANRPAEAAADKAAKAKEGSLFGALAQMIAGGGNIIKASDGPSSVSATATDKYKAVTVRKGGTVELPFGPPYTPTVTTMSYGVPNGKGAQLYLEMSLVGIGGEACTNMTVKGGRPGKPEFTISDPKGKVVQEGSFEYG